MRTGLRSSQDRYNLAGCKPEEDANDPFKKKLPKQMKPRVTFTAVCETNYCKLIVISASDFVKQFKNSLD